MAKANETIDALLESNLDVSRRRVYLFDDIETRPVFTLIKALYLLDAQDEEEPIDLFISSEGGDVYKMNAIIDVLATIHAPVHTHALGFCMSAAPLIVAAGEKGHRYATPNTWFMVHKGQLETDPDANKQKIEMNQFERLHNRWLDLMAKHTNKDKKFWDDLCNQPGDYYFDAQEAVKYGVVDEIWDEKEGE